MKVGPVTTVRISEHQLKMRSTRESELRTVLVWKTTTWSLLHSVLAVARNPMFHWPILKYVSVLRGWDYADVESMSMPCQKKKEKKKEKKTILYLFHGCNFHT